MENENVKDNHIFPLCVSYSLGNLSEDDKEFMAQYNNCLSNCFNSLYKQQNEDPAYVYTPLSNEQCKKFEIDFDYKIECKEILFSEKSTFDCDEIVLLYEVFCLNVLYQKMLADELLKQGTNEANKLNQEKIQEPDKLKTEIKNSAFYQNLFDELIYNSLEFKSDDDVIKFLFEKTFGSKDDDKNQSRAKFDHMKKEILDCVEQVKAKKHPVICIANADNDDAAKNKYKYGIYTFVQWKKWDKLPDFEKAHEKKEPDREFNNVLSVGDDKIFDTEEIKPMETTKLKETKKLLSQCIDDYLDEKDGDYKNFFVLIDYYSNFCSKQRSSGNDFASDKLFSAKKKYLWRKIEYNLKVIFQNGKRDNFMEQFNNKFIENEEIKCDNEQAKAEIIDIIELSSTVQYGKIMTYNGYQYDPNKNDIYGSLLDNSRSNCLNYLEGDMYTKYSVYKIKNEFEYKRLCKKIIFKNEISYLDENTLSLIFEVFLLNVLYKKMSNINLSKDNTEITDDLDDLFSNEITDSILDRGLFEKFRQKLVIFENEDDVIEFLYKETFCNVSELDSNNKIFSTMKNEILDCVKALKKDKNQLVFFTDNKFVKEKYSSYKYKPWHIFVWERKDDLPKFKEKTTIKLKENIKDVLCAFDNYIFGIDNKKGKNETESSIKNDTDEDTVIENNIHDAKNEKIDFLLLSESIADYLNACNFHPGDETRCSTKVDDDELSPEQKADNNFLDLIEYYCKFCAREKELPSENKNDDQHQLFNAKKKYLLGHIENCLWIMKYKEQNNNNENKFVILFISKFIENHNIKANNDAEKKEIANFINWLNENGFYPHDKSYFVILDDKIYPTHNKDEEIIKDLDIFFDIDLDKCTIKLKSEEFRSAVYNVLKDQTNKIDRSMLFKSFYERVMKDKEMAPEKKKECLNKIIPQLLEFISVYGLLDKTELEYNDNYVCYYLGYDRVNELTDGEKMFNVYFPKLMEDIESGGRYRYYNDEIEILDHLKILDAIKNMVDNKKLTLRENNVKVIKLLIGNIVMLSLEDKKVDDFIKKKYLRAIFEKTDVNDIKKSEEFKCLTLACEIVSGLVGNNKEHEVQKFFMDELVELFGVNKFKGFLLRFIDRELLSEEVKINFYEKNDTNCPIAEYIAKFNNALHDTPIDSVIEVFGGIEPNFDLAISICERLCHELKKTRIERIRYNQYDTTTRLITAKDTTAYQFIAELFSILLNSQDKIFKLDSKEKMKRVYVLYLEIRNFKKNIPKEEMEKIQNEIRIKIYLNSTFNLLKNNSKIGDERVYIGSGTYYKLTKELFKFAKWIEIVNSDDIFFEDFVVDIVSLIESQDYKGSENDKNKFYDIYSVKNLDGYRSFQNQLSKFFVGFYSAVKNLLEFDKDKRSKFIFDTDLFLELAEKKLNDCLCKDFCIHKLLFQSDFIFVLPINEIKIDDVNNAFRGYSQKLQEIFKDKQGNGYPELYDDFLGLFEKALISHCELILSNEKYRKGKSANELKNDYIKTIAMFCRDKETKIIRSVLENCTRTAEKQKNKFIKPYAIIEALLNDENFKLDAEKIALIIEWLVKYDVNELGIELKENKAFDNLNVIINKLYDGLKSNNVGLNDNDSLLWGKVMIKYYELILMHSKNINQRDELKDDCIKTIATFWCGKETKIIRSVLENCTRTAEEQKNKFIKPYAIIEALLNDDNFKLDVDKTALIIEWFIKYDVDKLGIELKENETYDNLSVINKLFEKIETDQVELDYKLYNDLFKNKLSFMPNNLNNFYHLKRDNNYKFESGADRIINSIANKICNMLNEQVKPEIHSMDRHSFQLSANNFLRQHNRNEIIPNHKENSTTLKITKWIGFSLITTIALVLILNNFITMFSLSLFLSIPLILTCIIFDMVLFENGQRILKSILKCIFCCCRQNDGGIKTGTFDDMDSFVDNKNKNEIIDDNKNIKLISTNELEKNSN